MSEQDYQKSVEAVLETFKASGLSRLQAAEVAACAINALFDNDGTADSPVTMKNNMMSLHIEIKGLYCPTRTGYETKLAEQLRRAASQLQVEVESVKVAFSTRPSTPDLPTLLQGFLEDHERNSKCKHSLGSPQQTPPHAKGHFAGDE